MKPIVKVLAIIGIVLLAVYLFKQYQYQAYFPGCNLVYASYLDCTNYPNTGNCGKQTSVKCGYTFLGDLGSSQTTKCDFGYGTPLGWQSETTMNYGETYSFFAYNGKTWYIFGYYCPPTTTTSPPTTTTTTLPPTTTTTTQPITTTITTTTTTLYPTATTTTVPSISDTTAYAVLALIIILPMALLAGYFALRKR